MADTMIVTLANGQQIRFGNAREAGLHEVSALDGAREVAEAQFERALGALGGLVDALEKTVQGLARRPEKIEMEFRASISGDCNLWVVKGDAEAEFKVTLAWGKAE